MNIIDHIPVHTLAKAVETAFIQVSGNTPMVISLWKSDLERIELLFPTPKVQIKNTQYPAIRTVNCEGEPIDVYLRRIVADFCVSEAGLNKSRAYTVELIDGDPTNLRRENIRLVFNDELSRKGKQQKRSSTIAEDIIRIRSDAVASGLCPDSAMKFLRALPSIRTQTGSVKVDIEGQA
ncbi:MAG: hypothetical protein AAF583_03540 [Pseudomonadota bacterium]